MVPALPGVGERFAVGVVLESAGEIQGLSLELGYDAAVVEMVGVEAGALLEVQETPSLVVSAGPGNVDAALFGSGATIEGSGELARAWFRVKAAGTAAIALRSVEARDAANRRVVLGGAVSTPAEPPRPTTTALMLARPNPFSGATTLSYALAQGGPVELAIYALDGRRVTTLEREVKAPGVYQASWNGSDERGVLVKPGMYYARLVTAAGRFSRTLVLMK
jgi:hypothetical protein